MPISSVHDILVVDDDYAVCKSLAMVLTASAYSARTAEHGLDALFQLRQKQAAIIISDLNMPQMSGFELLSVVRLRFPQTSVIAMSGAYESAEDLPFGVAADAFYPKGRSHPGTLLSMVADLIRTSRAHGVAHQTASAPALIPCTGHDAGMLYAMLPCRECLRSFPVTAGTEWNQKIQETPCIFCRNVVRFVMDGSSLGISPAVRWKTAAAGQSAGSGRLSSRSGSPQHGRA
ncbi:MAG TPA: response regulator [Candidatus Binatia bacterium]|nr:response regulator [Candidatus Binatia bacterium]